MAHVDLTPVGSVAQMKAAQAVVKSFDALDRLSDARDVAHDLILALDTVDFQSALDDNLAVLRDNFDAAFPDVQRSVLDTIPNLNQKV